MITSMTKHRAKKERDSCGRTETKTNIIRDILGPCLLLGKRMGALGLVQALAATLPLTQESFTSVSVYETVTNPP